MVLALSILCPQIIYAQRSVLHIVLCVVKHIGVCICSSLLAVVLVSVYNHAVISFMCYFNGLSIVDMLFVITTNESADCDYETPLVVYNRVIAKQLAANMFTW